MKCAKCGRERKQRWAGMRWGNKAICFTCWMDGWYFTSEGEIKHRALVVSVATMEEITKENWKRFAAKNFSGPEAA